MIHMRKRALILALLTGLVLSSCGKAKTYPTEAYRITLPFHTDYKIMQLTDIHVEIQSDIPDVESLLDKVLNQATYHSQYPGKPDLMVITGDTFMNATKAMVQEILDHLNSWQIPFAFTYGNHDLQGDYSYRYLADEVQKRSYARYIDYGDDDLYSQANYYLDLDENSQTKYRLYILDSNTYHLASGIFHYDVIHEDQLAHVEAIAKDEGVVPSLAFFHMPLYEFKDAYDAYLKGDCPGDGDDPGVIHLGYQRTDAFQRMKAVGVKVMFIGHDHVNDSHLLYQDVVLAYDLKATREIYHRDDRIGCTLIRLSDDTESFGLGNVERVFVQP